MATRLGLTGTPRRAPLWKNFGAPGGVRPDKQYSALGPTGTPRRPQAFVAKEPAGGTGSARPDKRYSSLGFAGVMQPRRKAFVAKAGAVGVSGRTTLQLIPAAITTIGRARRVTTDLVLGIRPMGAIITVAHTSNRQGRTTLALQPRSMMRYTRSGVHHEFHGSTTLAFSTFGNITIRHRRGILGTNSVVFTPRSTLVFTPAPVKHVVAHGSTTLRLTPQGTMTRVITGLLHSFTGHNLLEFGVFGQVSVRRATTVIVHGSTTLRLTPQATITKGTGPPLAFYVYGGTTLTLTPRGLVRYNLGDFEQHHVQGQVGFQLVPHSRITVRRAPSVTPALGNLRRGERRFIRLFRGRA